MQKMKEEKIYCKNCKFIIINHLKAWLEAGGR